MAALLSNNHWSVKQQIESCLLGFPNNSKSSVRYCSTFVARTCCLLSLHYIMVGHFCICLCGILPLQGFVSSSEQNPGSNWHPIMMSNRASFAYLNKQYLLRVKAASQLYNRAFENSTAIVFISQSSTFLFSKTPINAVV